MLSSSQYEELAELVMDTVADAVSSMSKKVPLTTAPEMKIEELPNGIKVNLELAFGYVDGIKTTLLLADDSTVERSG